MRLRSLRRACSSMGKVTSCHHSSPATASISSRCSRTLGTLASSSRLLASCCTLACRRASAVAAQQGQLGAQHQRVEALGILIIVTHRRGQARQVRGHLGELLGAGALPCTWLCPGLYPAALGRTAKLSSDMPATMLCSSAAVSRRMAASVRANDRAGASATVACKGAGPAGRSAPAGH